MSPLARRALALLALALPQLLFARPADARVPGDHNGKGVLATLRRMPRPDGLEPEDSLHRRQDADGMHWRPDGDRLQRRQSASTCRFSLFTMSVRDFSFTEESAVYEGWLTTVCDGDHSTEDLEVIDVKRNGLEQTGAERRNITDVTGFGANFTFYSTSILEKWLVIRHERKHHAYKKSDEYLPPDKRNEADRLELGQDAEDADRWCWNFGPCTNRKGDGYSDFLASMSLGTFAINIVVFVAVNLGLMLGYRPPPCFSALEC